MNFLLPNFYFLLCALLWIVVVEISAHSWYRLHEKNLVAQSGWSVQWPNTAPGFREIKINEEVRLTLRYDEGREATWFVSERPDSGETNSLRCTVFFFRWNPGSSSVLRARAHRPDICLPSVGWREIGDRGSKDYPVGEDASVPFQHLIFRQNRTGSVVHTFFCLQEDKPRSTAVRAGVENSGHSQTDWSFRGRCRAMINGVRNLGQQALECVFVSTRELDDASAEQQFALLARELVVPSPGRR